jgi:RNA polymerase sigma-70 factor (ECF subfamily)
MTDTADIAALLQHSVWLRRLAMSLVRDPAAADDLVQETWVAALQHPPGAGRPVRPWLGEVLRNVLRAGFRSNSRRARREDAAVDKQAQVPSAEQMVGAVELQRLLAEEVLKLKEPYLSTVLLRFYEGLSAAEIAERQKLPAGTIRWRLKEGLDQLRARLDRKYAGDRGAWMRALMPLTIDRAGRVGLAKSVTTSTLKGALAMKIGATVIVGAGVVTALLAVDHRTIAQRAPSAPKEQSSVEAPQAQTSAAVKAKSDSKAPPARPRLTEDARADLLRRIESARQSARSAASKAASSGSGSLDKEYVRQQMREILPLVKECYEQALARNPGSLPAMDGKLMVAFTIVADPSVGGLVSESRVLDEKSTIADKEMRECVQETMYAAKFGAPAEGGEVHVEYPFLFKHSDDQ